MRSNEESSNPDSSSVDDGDMLTAAKSSLKGSDSHRSMDMDQMEPHSSNENLGQLEESEKSFENFSKITNQANQTISNKVQSIKNEVLELKEEVQETKDLLIKAEEKNAIYETKIKAIDSVERNADAQPFDILAILPDSAR